MVFNAAGINVIVLAGGLNRIILYEGYTPGYKGLLPLKGKPLIQYTLDALIQTPAVRRICIVGPEDKIRKAVANPGQYEFVSGGETLIETINNGLDHFRESSFVLVIPSDLPLATPQAIGDFLEKCRGLKAPYKADIIWSMVPEKDFKGSYAEEKKKGFNRFRDVSVCHGNLLLITPSVMRNRRFVTRLDKIYNARKSSLRAARAVGPLLGLAYLLGVQMFRIFTLSRLARLASASFGVGLVPVIVDFPEVAIDIDEPRDYWFIKEELDRRRT